MAVNQNGYSLQFVEEQTEEICMAAVRRNRNNIKYVDIKKFSMVYDYYKLLYS